MKVGVVGAGGWGTALANLLSETNDVELWVREQELLEMIRKDRENRFFLPGIKLNENLKYNNSLSFVKDKELIVMAVPSQFVRQTVKDIKKYITNQVVVGVSKGLEIGSYKRMSEVLKEELGVDVLALSGPNHCEEVAKKMPTATVLAGEDLEILDSVQQVFNRNYFKVYPHDDIVGVELCGAIKNITAIATGVVDGLGLGDNTKASIITLGLMEMNTFCRHFGAKRATIYGLAGVGDLIATCTSKLSRNRFVGEKLVQGMHFNEIKNEMKGMVAEGVTTAKAVHDFSVNNHLDMHLTSQVYKVIYEEKDLKKAIKDLIDLI